MLSLSIFDFLYLGVTGKQCIFFLPTQERKKYRSLNWASDCGLDFSRKKKNTRIVSSTIKFELVERKLFLGLLEKKKSRCSQIWVSEWAPTFPGKNKIRYTFDPSKPLPCFNSGRLTKITCSNFIPTSKSPISFFYCLFVRCGYFWFINPPFRRFFKHSPSRLFRNTFFLCSSIGEKFAFTHLTFVSESSLSVFYFLSPCLAPIFILYFEYTLLSLKGCFYVPL